jgi:hypothetical protein
MNHWHNGFMAEYHRQQILEEVEHIRLEKLAVRSRVYRPGMFARSMFRFANWMISTGKLRRWRYEVPAVNCSKPPTGCFVH